MILKRLHSILLIVLAISIVICSKQVQDFTYSEHMVIQQQDLTKRIRLSPQRSAFQRYDFPNTWEITQFLSQSLQKEDPLPQISNIDGQISFLKSQMSQFLKLSNKAELLVKNIKQLPEMKNDLTLDVRTEEFIAIQNQESTLRAINDQINNKGVELQKIVQQLIIQQQNPLFKQAALNFQKKALTQKIVLFNHILSQANSDKKAVQQKANDQKVITYFKQLDQIFETENGLIDAIDTLLKSHNELTILKARVTSLTSQLKAHQLTLAEKQECASEFEKIKQKQAHDRQVIKLIETLKQKKLQYNEPNKYCEGVVKKLIDRIKKLLVGYDYVFDCAQQLGEVKQNRDKIQKQLDQAQRKLDELQLSKGVQDFRRNFENNRAVIAEKVQQLKTLELDGFYRDPNLVQIAILDSQQRIKQIEKTLINLPAQSSYDLTETQHLIRQKVGQIKSLKAQYCKQNEVYVQNSQIIESRLSKLQQQQQFNTWIKNVEIQKFEQLESIKREMQQIEASILAYMNN